MSDDALIPDATFRLLRKTPDLKTPEAIKGVLEKEGIGAVIINDEKVQHLPPAERFKKAEALRTRFRGEVAVDLHAAAVKILRKLERPDG